MTAHPPVSTGHSPLLDARLEALYARHAGGIKLGLENVAALMEELGSPHQALAPIHVAGTNGKGSVCAMLDAVLRAHGGVTCGIYTSPHLIRFNERIRIDGVPISDADLLALLEEVDRADRIIAAKPGLRRSTFFEFTTAAALAWFQRMRARVPVVETGLGGRLDATNVVQPLLVILTAMARDHMEYLGTDLRGIAAEKAGIIKPGRPVICGLMRDEARRVVLDMARQRGAPVIDVRDVVSVKLIKESLDGQRVKVETASASYAPFTLPLLGRHQLENLAAAVAAGDYLNDSGTWLLSEDRVRAGLEQVCWPGRLQVLQRDPPVVLDAAHNPAGAAVLAKALGRLLPGWPIGMVTGMASDKDAAGFMRRMAPHVARSWTVTLDNPRGLPSEEIQRLAEAAGLPADSAPLPDALDRARDWAVAHDGAVLITGSIYLLGEVFEHLGISPYPTSP